MLSEANHRVAALQLSSNCCGFIAIFTALSSATLKSERAFYSQLLFYLLQWLVMKLNSGSCSDFSKKLLI